LGKSTLTISRDNEKKKVGDCGVVSEVDIEDVGARMKKGVEKVTI